MILSRSCRDFLIGSIAQSMTVDNQSSIKVKAQEVHASPPLLLLTFN